MIIECCPACGATRESNGILELYDLETCPTCHADNIKRCKECSEQLPPDNPGYKHGCSICKQPFENGHLTASDKIELRVTVYNGFTDSVTIHAACGARLQEYLKTLLRPQLERNMVNEPMLYREYLDTPEERKSWWRKTYAWLFE